MGLIHPTLTEDNIEGDAAHSKHTQMTYEAISED